MANVTLTLLVILCVLVLNGAARKHQRSKPAKNPKPVSGTTTLAAEFRRRVSEASPTRRSFRRRRATTPLPVKPEVSSATDVLTTSLTTKDKRRAASKPRKTRKPLRGTKQKATAAEPSPWKTIDNQIAREEKSAKRQLEPELVKMRDACVFAQGNKARILKVGFQCYCSGVYIRNENPESCVKSVCKSAVRNPCNPGKCIDDLTREAKYRCDCPDIRHNDSYCQGIKGWDSRIRMAEKRRRDATNSEPMTITFDFADEPFDLKLKPHFILEKNFKNLKAELDDQGQTTLQELSFPNSVLGLLEGHVWTTDDGEASLYVVDRGENPVKVEGIICDMHEIFFEDLAPSLKEDNSGWLSGQVSHKVSTIEYKDFPNDGGAIGSLPEPRQRRFLPTGRSDSKELKAKFMDPKDAPSEVVLKILVVFDDINTATLNNKTREHTIAFVTTFWFRVNLAFYNASGCPKIRIMVVGVILLTDSIMKNVLGDTIEDGIDMEATAEKFGEWVNEVKGNESMFANFDAVILHTNRKLYKPGTTTEYPSFTLSRGPCEHYTVMTVDAGSYGSTAVAAHALYSFLVQCCNTEPVRKFPGCPDEVNYLESTERLEGGMPRMEFSPCAIREMELYVKNPFHKCLWSVPEPFFPEDLLPGSKISVHAQCIRRLGRKDTEYKGPIDASICEGMICCDGPEDSPTEGAMDGTPCGYNMMCVKGECISYSHPTAYDICRYKGEQLYPDFKGMCDELRCGKFEVIDALAVYRVREGTRCQHPELPNAICIHGECFPLNDTTTQRKRNIEQPEIISAEDEVVSMEDGF